MSNKPYFAFLLQRERQLPDTLSALALLENIGKNKQDSMKISGLRSLLNGSGDSLIEKARQLGVRPCDLLSYWGDKKDNEIVQAMCLGWDWNHFKAWRIMRNMTREEAAEKLGIKAQTMISYERKSLNGLRNHKHFASTIKNFARVYECSEDDFKSYLFNRDNKQDRLSDQEREQLNLDNHDPLIDKVIRIARYRNVLMPRAFRLYYGWTIAELSEITGISNVSSIYSLEKNTIKISEEKKKLLAKAFKCKKEDLNNKVLCQNPLSSPKTLPPLSLYEKRELLDYLGTKIATVEKATVSGLRVFRKMHGDTLDKLGKICACSKQNISQLEANITSGRESKNPTVQCLMEHYGCEYHDLSAIYD